MLYSHLERTLLHPAVTIDEQFAALEEAIRLGFAGLTAAPFWIKKWRRELGEQHPLALTAVIGYPFGYQRTEAKQLEAELALKDGASELEMVVNTSAVFSASSGWVKVEIAKLVTLAHAHETPLTVVLETSLLPDEWTRKLVKTAADAGADFLKNGTGALETTFSIEKAMAFRQLVPASVGVKVLGDGATNSEMKQLVEAGIDRICVSRFAPIDVD
ncbi:deoxyribose-phosphate aldolase [Tellurirhabdus rosea]|uniref:deoxyribose-phosphate aldolase n=1 Tax=Tellurirhabdus rosea TaxID=2674997 RepID=UPI00225B21F4|nr:deoxyribose-phosphate aldolase [Tellurirhabdus rosea]